MTVDPTQTDLSPADEIRLAMYIERALAETERAKTLSNEQLVREISDLIPFGEWDELIAEAFARLDPGWDTREDPGPPTP